MRFPMLAAVFRKEMLDILRDRRTLISMVAMPVLVIPLMMFFMGSLIGRAEQKAEEEMKRLGIAAKLATGRFRPALAASGLPLRAAADPAEAVREKKAAVGAVETASGIELLIDRANPASAAAGAAVREVLDKAREAEIRAGLASAKVPASVLEPFTIRQTNLASARRMAGNLWGSLLGYMLLLLMFTGGMYPIIDMTAGEKERKTIEAFLAAPVHRLEIVTGKILAGTVAIAVTAALTLASLVFSLRNERFAGRSPEMKAMLQTIPLDAQNLTLIAVSLLPLAIFAASLMIAIATFARSFKEGQSYLTPLALLVIFPALLGGLPGLELSPATALLPILNVSQLIRGILLGDFTPLVFGITLAANIVYAALAAFIATRTFNNEKVLFRS
jgi:sodium transport system permease protein